MPTTDLAIAACCLFYVAFTVFAAGFIGWICERQQLPYRRTVHLDPLLGDFADAPTEPVIDIVRRQGPAQEQIDKHNEWRLHHELGTQSQWWADQLRMEGAGDA